MRRLDNLETAKEKMFKKALGPQQTKRSAEANLASGKRVELPALRRLARLYMLGLGGYGSGQRIRPVRALIRSP
jgi:hypothetical protein